MAEDDDSGLDSFSFMLGVVLRRVSLVESLVCFSPSILGNSRMGLLIVGILLEKNGKYQFYLKCLC